MSSDRDGQKKRAVVVFSLDNLKTMLRLPIGVEIDHVMQDDADRYTGCFKMLLSGDDLPEQCWTASIPVRCTLRYVETGDTFPDLECQVEHVRPNEAQQPLAPAPDK